MDSNIGAAIIAARAPAYVLGAMIHTMMGVVIALVHVAIYKVLGIESGFAVWGLAIGIGHAVLVGGMGMPMIGMIHPLIRSGQLMAPGFMVTNHPMGTVVGFFMVHAVFGVVTGLTYEAIV